MRIEQLILTIDTDDSGTLEGHSGGVFQPRQAEVSCHLDGSIDMLITGPRVKKDGGLHASAHGRWWATDDDTPWPPIAVAVREAFDRAVDAVAREGGTPDA